MIKDEYVSFNTSVLLNDKGFNAKCRKVYMYDGTLEDACRFIEGESMTDKEGIRIEAAYDGWNPSNNGEYAFLCPTLQMARKWLREDHNILVEAYRTFTGYSFHVMYNDSGNMIFDANAGQYPQIWNKYEEAEDAGIEYALGKI